jgi:hypothetical protein
MHGPQATSSPRTPASAISNIAPDFSRLIRIWREPGENVMCKCGATFLPLIISATIFKSRYDEFTEEPTATCFTSMFSCASSRTGTTLSGEWGLTTSGSSLERSISIASS